MQKTSLLDRTLQQNVNKCRISEKIAPFGAISHKPYCELRRRKLLQPFGFFICRDNGFHHGAAESAVFENVNSLDGRAAGTANRVL